MYKAFLFAFSILSIHAIKAQDSHLLKEPIITDLILPNTLSTHPFGIYISRISHNFQTRPNPKASIGFNYSNGNVWLPQNKAYKPTSADQQELIKTTSWDDRQRLYDLSLPAKTSTFYSDGVYRVFRMQFAVPLGKQQELTLNARAYLFDKGNTPYSLFTSDDFIEWFHSNVAGGEDAFKRKFYGINEAYTQYTSFDGKSFELNQGSSMFTGIEADYTYYPGLDFLEERLFFTNLGVHLGLNTNPINPGADAGFSGSILKKIPFRKRFEWNMGFSLAALNQSFVRAGEGYSISSSPWLYSFDLMTGVGFISKKNAEIFIGIDWWGQSAYNRKEDFDDIVLTVPGPEDSPNWSRESPHWFQTMKHLYRTVTASNFMFTYSKSNYSISCYLREDFLVDNAPDAQTGIELRVFLDRE